MSVVTVHETELLSFFAVEPTVIDPDAPWPYNGYTYQLEFGLFWICFSIDPAYKDVSLTVAHRGAEFYAFKGRSLRDVLYHKASDVETLQIAITDTDNIWFRLRPDLLITQDAGEA